MIESVHKVLRAELAAFRGREVRNFSDGVMGTFDGPARAVKFARSAREKVRRQCHSAPGCTANASQRATMFAEPQWI